MSLPRPTLPLAFSLRAANRAIDLCDCSRQRCVDTCELGLEHQQLAVGFDQAEEVSAFAAIVGDRQFHRVFGSGNDPLLVDVALLWAVFGSHVTVGSLRG